MIKYSDITVVRSVCGAAQPYAVRVHMDDARVICTWPFVQRPGTRRTFVAGMLVVADPTWVPGLPVCIDACDAVRLLNSDRGCALL